MDRDVTLVSSTGTSEGAKASDLVTGAGRKATATNDGCGAIYQRVVAMIGEQNRTGGR
jgi:hypothetical protein